MRLSTSPHFGLVQPTWLYAQPKLLEPHQKAIAELNGLTGSEQTLPILIQNTADGGFNATLCEPKTTVHGVNLATVFQKLENTLNIRGMTAVARDSAGRRPQKPRR